MMTRFWAWVPALLLMALAAPAAQAQVPANPRADVDARVGGAEIRIEHGQPALGGRDVRTLVTPGQLWRLGADDNTTLEVSAPVRIGGQRLSPGKYTLIVRFKSQSDWELLALSRGDAFMFDPAGVALTAPLEIETLSQPRDRLALAVGGDGKLAIEWGTLRATTTIQSP